MQWLIKTDDRTEKMNLTQPSTSSTKWQGQEDLGQKSRAWELEQVSIPELPGIGMVTLKANFDAGTAPNSWVHLQGLELPAEATGWLANGINCWTDSPILGKADHLKRETNPLQMTFGDQEILPYPETSGIFHSWSFSYGDTGSSDLGVPFLAAIDEDQSFTVFKIDLNTQQVTISIDTAGLKWDEGLQTVGIWLIPLPQSKKWPSLATATNYWMQAIRKHERFPRQIDNVSKSRFKPQVLGYTSWYNRFTEISQETLENDLDAISNHADWKVFQVDDGYQIRVGDWLTPATSFPNGVKNLVPKIKANGLTPGIWIAPFVALEHSDFFKTNPHLLLKDEQGNLVLCGDFEHWGGKFYALDTEHPEFKAHLKETLRVYFKEWGFEFLKADFLYAAARVPAGGLTRAQRGVRAHQMLWDICREFGATLLSCGAVLSNAYGRCEFSRIGPDISLSWEDPALTHHHSREKPSTRAAIVNTITRAALDGVMFFNDPDVVILREENTGLTQAEKEMLVRVNRAFGSLLFCSDDLSLWKEPSKQLRQHLEEDHPVQQGIEKVSAAIMANGSSSLKDGFQITDPKGTITVQFEGRQFNFVEHQTNR